MRRQEPKILSLLHGGIGLPTSYAVYTFRAGQKGEEKLTGSKTLHDFTIANRVLFYIKFHGSGFYAVLFVSAEKEIGHTFLFNFLWGLKICTNMIFNTALQ